MARIIPIFKFTTRPLTPLMKLTLRVACNRQIHNEPIGKIDLDGSFMALLKRGFIDSRTILVQGSNEVVWYVTTSGLNALK